MLIKKIEIKNYKCFESFDFDFGKYVSFVGENNSGKSAIFCAIDDFLNSTSRRTPITEDDFYIGEDGVRRDKLFISIIFSDLSNQAIQDFKEYTNTSEVRFKLKCQLNNGRVSSKFIGIRKGMPEFANAFEVGKKPPVSNLNEEYEKLCIKFEELPPKKEVSTKELKLSALREYESARPELCKLIESGDEAYGAVGPCSKLQEYFKWILIPAVKDASDESTEGKNILSELVEFAARKQTNFDEKISEIEEKVKSEVSQLRADQQSVLKKINNELNSNFSKISMGKEKIELNWGQSDNDLKLKHPTALANIVSGMHKGPVAKFGHGLQRNYLMSLFKVINEIGKNEETGESDYHLVIGFEEPELYQHPPQARLLARYLWNLAKTDQVLITTHSPIFVNEDVFGNLHLVRNRQGLSTIHSVTLESFTTRMSKVFDLPIADLQSAVARLATLLDLNIAELFFSKFVILVEGLEDVGYLRGAIEAYGYEEKFLQHGYNIIPTMGKNEMVPVIELCKAFNIPHFVILDADSKHETASAEKAKNTKKVNEIIFKQLENISSEPFIEEIIVGNNACIWPDNIQAAFIKEKPEFKAILDEATNIFKNGKKNPKATYLATKNSYENLGELEFLKILLEAILKKMSI